MGGLPEELELGFLVERFQQTPFQLGFCETNDYALLCRCLQATQIHQACKVAATDLAQASTEQARVVMRLKKRFTQLKGRPRWLSHTE